MPAAGGRRRLLVRVALGAAAVFAVLQLVPYGWRHSNPPVAADARWPTPAAERLARAACYACHSNETDWPAYSYVAPMSWLVRYDVERGRDERNFSEWAATTARPTTRPRPSRTVPCRRGATRSSTEATVRAAAGAAATGAREAERTSGPD